MLFPAMDNEGITLLFDGYLVTIDFREKLYKMALQRMGEGGRTVIDLLEVFDIKTGQGKSCINVKLHLDEGLRRGLSLLKEKVKKA